MYEIISTDVKGEGRGESEVGSCACVEIEGEDSGWISDYGFNFDSVNEWLS